MFDFLFRQVRYWRALREAGPLMAQAVYEPLAPEEEARLQTLIEAFPELKQESDGFTRVAQVVRLREDNWTGDLLPVLRQRIAETEASPARASHVPAYAIAASLTVLIAAGLYAVFMLSGDDGVSVRRAAAPAPPIPETTLVQAKETACDLVAQGETERAADLLERAIYEHPVDAYHAEALLTLADIEYSYLQRYDRAYEAFKRLEQDHRDQFNRNWDHDKRVRLLSAALPDGFAPLRELEAAAKSDHPLQGYEDILVEYPDTLWADEAVTHMARLVARNTNADPADTVEVLQRVRNACSQPVARDRIDLEIGNYYCDSLDDLEQARSHYALAASSRHVALAAKAREALARLE